ncbi:MmcB family DNA repair protein [Sphingosinicella sp. BN140058]|uniref:MmcB family DNA repair protein n=1 Tax=Sphingosinicella sp. BN140058 TaxID=1892855 RepID=UPI001010A8D3|nr:MmcB family DNA repair protein [Sphingosinicella sp. BN140058]QAY76900.1 DNA repair protein MmcB-related protein [Sphingosinicella sp. BN140058]
MATNPRQAPCFQEAPLVAQDVARGVTRLFFNQDSFALCEVPLPNGRRADMMALDAGGLITIVEIKVSRADLLGDCKWPDYLDYCDRFFWAVPARFDLSPFETDDFHPHLCGLIVADRYDAAVVREAALRKLAPARRKSETLRFARRAARRLVGDLDPALAGLSSPLG